MKRTLVVQLIVLAVIGVILGFRLLTPEDTWVCRDGQWVKHGQPDMPMPSGSCR